LRTKSEVRSGGRGHQELYYWAGVQEDGRLVITGTEARHIARVMRHKPGDIVRVADGAGRESRLELAEVRPEMVTGRVLCSHAGGREPAHQVAVAQAVLKGDKLAQVCEQAVEMGVSEVIPFESRYTIGRLSPAKIERLNAVSLGAMKSSMRTSLPRVGAAVGLRDVAARAAEFDQALVAYEDEGGPGLAQALDRKAGSVLLVIGPEGGFETDEIAALKEAGVVPFTLGPRRLRAETAAVAAATLALGLLGDLG
jgi:16S rRNA (uracil1498-N3)-methyltransferase